MPANSSPFFAYGDGKIQTDFVADFGSTDQYGRGVLLQPDGRIVVSGTNFLVRYNADGSLDTAFGEAGRTVVPFPSSSGTGQVAALQDDGKILFAGTLYNEGVFSYAVARYLADGARPLGEVAALLGFSAPSAFSRWHRQRFGRPARQGRPPH